MAEQLDLSGRPDAPAVGWEGMPEVVAVGRLRDQGADERRVGLFLTFTAAMDRARDADRLWANSARLFDDEPWVFDPAEIDGVDDTDRRRASRTQGEPATLR